MHNRYTQDEEKKKRETHVYNFRKVFTHIAQSSNFHTNVHTPLAHSPSPCAQSTPSEEKNTKKKITARNIIINEVKATMPILRFVNGESGVKRRLHNSAQTMIIDEASSEHCTVLSTKCTAFAEGLDG